MKEVKNSLKSFKKIFKKMVKDEDQKYFNLSFNQKWESLEFEVKEIIKKTVNMLVEGGTITENDVPNIEDKLWKKLRKIYLFEKMKDYYFQTFRKTFFKRHLESENIQINLDHLEEISNLLIGKTNNDFLIFQHPKTSKFVQVICSEEGSILIDLPIQNLNKLEFERAKEFFNEKGASDLISRNLLEYPSGSSEGKVTAFNIELDSEKAIEVIKDVFTDIYKYETDIQIIIESGSFKSN